MSVIFFASEYKYKKMYKKNTLQNQYGTEPGKRTMGGAVAPGVFVILPNEEGRSAGEVGHKY